MKSKTLDVSVDVDETLRLACEPFDYSFDGKSEFCLPNMDAPLRDDSWSIGLIVGPSGSGKSQLLRMYYGESVEPKWDSKLAIVSQLGTHQEAMDKLAAVGLNSVPAWCRPYHVLSNGEQFRARMARMLESNSSFDEFTSVVDRSVARSCSNAIQRHIRKANLRGVVLATCHYDVIEWLQPDWVFDTLTASMMPRGCLCRRQPIQLTVEPCARSWWDVFKHHHYLSHDLSPSCEAFIAWWGGNPVAFSAALPMPSGTLKNAWRGHRTVVLPDFQGLGIGVRLSDWMGERMISMGRRYYSKTAHPRMGGYRDHSPLWRPTIKNRLLRNKTQNAINSYNSIGDKFRAEKDCWSHEYIGKNHSASGGLAPN